MTSGYVTFVQNSPTTDYLRLAYAQALSIKTTQRKNSYAIIVDGPTAELVEDRHRRVFDHVVVMPDDSSAADTWKLGNHWRLWNLTPFRETVLLDSDILFTRDVSHWWSWWRLREVCITTNVVDHTDRVSSNRKYRRLFDDNGLLNTYNGLSYFRYSQTMKAFFIHAREVYENWPTWRDKHLKNCRHPQAHPDEVWAIAADMVGRDKCWIPNGPAFAHLKPAIVGNPEEMAWYENNSWSWTSTGELIIGGYAQHQPVHYYHKEWLTDEIIHRYEKLYDR